MGDRVLEIVVFLMSELQDERGQMGNLEEISDYLRGQGFTENEISTAYSWFLDRLQTDTQFLYNTASSGNSLRVLSELERQYFSTEAYGFIFQLHHLGLLDDEQMELVLERGTLLWPSPVNLEQIKILIRTVLFSEMPNSDILKQSAFLSDDVESVN